LPNVLACQTGSNYTAFRAALPPDLLTGYPRCPALAEVKGINVLEFS
jgi:hypothetical protein